MKVKTLLVLLPILSFVLTSCEKVPNTVELTIDDIEVISHHTAPQEEYLNSEDPMDYVDDNYLYFNNEAAGDKNITAKPAPLEISFKVTTDNGAKARSYSIRYGEKEDELDLCTTSTSIPVKLYNLKINKQYYYRVEANFKDKTHKSDIYTFTTNNDIGLRNMYIEGVENFRDLGGYALENGKHFKQGMIYRSAQFNYDPKDESAVKSKPTSNGLYELLNNLKIKTDVDFREKNNAKGKDETIGLKDKSPLGNSVKYQYLPMRYGGSNVITSSNNKESVLAFLNLLADENSYPLVFHCVQGKDRTGALAYAIEALLGVSEDLMKKDYLFTNFAKVGSSITKWSSVDGTGQFPWGIAHSEGTTISQKARNYLKIAVGVSDSTLDKIIELLSE